jgi:hypothetical protein
MHSQMPQQQYMSSNYGLFSSPPLHPISNSLPHSAHSFLFNSYDRSHYTQKPYAQFDLSRPMNQLQYLPNRQPSNAENSYQSGQSQSPQMNNYALSSSAQMMLYQTPESQRRPPQQPPFLREESSSIPASGQQSAVIVPEFDRTYTDVAEDEFDETPHNPEPSSNNHKSRLSGSGSFALQNLQKCPSLLYVDNAGGVIHNRTYSEQQSQPQHNSQQQVTSGLGYRDTYHLLNPSQQISSAAVAASVRRLKPPNRTTVSPREAFLDYPDNADFREKRVFSNSQSPYSNGHGAQEIPDHQESESSGSNEDDFQVSDSMELTSSIPVNLAPYLHGTRTTGRPRAFPATSSRSNSSTAREFGMPSSDASRERSNGSGSEYNPTVSLRAGRSSGRGSTVGRTFPRVDCGKRFDTSRTLQNHRRHSHGKATGPPTLSALKFSNSSHRCEFVDPTTGKTCNTVFSRP